MSIAPRILVSAEQADGSVGATTAVEGIVALGVCVDVRCCRAEVALADFPVFAGQGEECDNGFFLLDFGAACVVVTEHADELDSSVGCVKMTHWEKSSNETLSGEESGWVGVSGGEDVKESASSEDVGTTLFLQHIAKLLQLVQSLPAAAQSQIALPR